MYVTLAATINKDQQKPKINAYYPTNWTFGIGRDELTVLSNENLRDKTKADKFVWNKKSVTGL